MPETTPFTPKAELDRLQVDKDPSEIIPNTLSEDYATNFHKISAIFNRMKIRVFWVTALALLLGCIYVLLTAGRK